MRAIIYSRVSTGAQRRDGTSLDTEERACRELAAAGGWSVVQCVRDAASRYHPDRSGIEDSAPLCGAVTPTSSCPTRSTDSPETNHIGVVLDEWSRPARS